MTPPSVSSVVNLPDSISVGNISLTKARSHKGEIFIRKKYSWCLRVSVREINDLIYGMLIRRASLIETWPTPAPGEIFPEALYTPDCTVILLALAKD